MGGEQFDIEADADHAFLIYVHDPDDEIMIKLRLGEEAVRDLDVDGTREPQIAAATVSYLLSRQEAFDLPGELDLEDIVAAYPDFREVIRRDVGIPPSSDRSARP